MLAQTVSVACMLVEINLNKEKKRQRQQSFSGAQLLVSYDVCMPNIAIRVGLFMKMVYICVHQTNETRIPR